MAKEQSAHSDIDSVIALAGLDELLNNNVEETLLRLAEEAEQINHYSTADDSDMEMALYVHQELQVEVNRINTMLTGLIAGMESDSINQYLANAGYTVEEASSFKDWIKNVVEKFKGIVNTIHNYIVVWWQNNHSKSARAQVAMNAEIAKFKASLDAVSKDKTIADKFKRYMESANVSHSKRNDALFTNNQLLGKEVISRRLTELFAAISPSKSFRSFAATVANEIEVSNVENVLEADIIKRLNDDIVKVYESISNRVESRDDTVTALLRSGYNIVLAKNKQGFLTVKSSKLRDAEITVGINDKLPSFPLADIAPIADITSKAYGILVTHAKAAATERASLSIVIKRIDGLAKEDSGLSKRESISKVATVISTAYNVCTSHESALAAIAASFTDAIRDTVVDAMRRGASFSIPTGNGKGKKK